MNQHAWDVEYSITLTTHPKVLAFQTLYLGRAGRLTPNHTQRRLFFTKVTAHKYAKLASEDTG